MTIPELNIGDCEGDKDHAGDGYHGKHTKL